MRLIEIKYPIYTLQHRSGYTLHVRAKRLDDERLTFEPVNGWDDAAQQCQQDTESLLEDIDDVIYNATPEVYGQD
jgi:hypothetical protein